MQLLHNGQAVLIGVEDIKPEDLPDNLKVIGCPMTGTEHLPWDYIKAKGIKVISLHGETEFLQEITSTAEHAMGLILALLRNYRPAFFFPYEERNAYTGHTLKGKTLGILGYGRIGKQVERIAEAFQMNVVSFDNAKTPNWTEEFLTDKPLVELVQNSDIVSLHIPLSGNEGFFGKWLFQLMKPTSYFVNTSRLGVVEPGALLWALENKAIAGAAVDFTEAPELREYEKTHDNLILTPHLGGNTFEDREKTLNFIKAKVDAYLKNNS